MINAETSQDSVKNVPSPTPPLLLLRDDMITLSIETPILVSKLDQAVSHIERTQSTVPSRKARGPSVQSLWLVVVLMLGNQGLRLGPREVRDELASFVLPDRMSFRCFLDGRSLCCL